MWTIFKHNLMPQREKEILIQSEKDEIDQDDLTWIIKLLNISRKFKIA